MAIIQVNDDNDLRSLFLNNQPQVGDDVTMTYVPLASFQNSKVTCSIDGLINVEVSTSTATKTYSIQKYAHRIVVFLSANHQLTSVYELLP
ncbi:hypothetical protein [Photobacterium phosphoreum]|uniref:hypothetical protein n=1 Tax=Photobacterium phosphoreum TaxID=659 RepID=UPI001E2A1644|nr:hypothetical protein [Photobacterium phosphoreum]MCD9506439.1 hypothetical protein [Photobacterium phosphoreum]